MFFFAYLLTKNDIFCIIGMYFHDEGVSKAIPQKRLLLYKYVNLMHISASKDLLQKFYVLQT